MHFTLEMMGDVWPSNVECGPGILTSDVQSSTVVLPVQACDFVEVKPVDVIQTGNAGLEEVLWLVDVVQPAVGTRRPLIHHFDFLCFGTRRRLLWQVTDTFLLHISFIIVTIAVGESPAGAVRHLLLPLSSQRRASFKLHWI